MYLYLVYDRNQIILPELEQEPELRSGLTGIGLPFWKSGSGLLDWIFINQIWYQTRLQTGVLVL